MLRQLEEKHSPNYIALLQGNIDGIEHVRVSEQVSVAGGERRKTG